MKYEIIETPKYLYKIVSPEQWKASEQQQLLMLSADDASSIRLLKEDEIGRTVHYLKKTNTPHVILKIKSSKLIGRLVFEPKPGGSSKQYHLYDGQIPMNAIVEFKVVTN